MDNGAAPIVVALGGNAISPPGERGDIPQQFSQTRHTARHLAELLLSGAPVVITHGNGPQVGNAVRRVELSMHEVYPLDLGICVADLEGGMGYMIAQCLMNELNRRGTRRLVSAVVTTVEVDGEDPAFEDPAKPIGSFYTEDQARKFMATYGWHMKPVSSHGWRRVVPSPIPKAIIEIELIRSLVAAGELLVAVGGGGIPVVREPDGTLNGVEAVIDKDLASGLLAGAIDAGTFLIITNQSTVYLDYETPNQRAVDRLTVAEALRHSDAGQFPPGSMGPKIRAAIDFLAQSNRRETRVIITDMEHIDAALAGAAGTTITSG
jgi:carbamate kinase